MAAKTEQQRRQSRADSKRRRRKQNQRALAVLTALLLAALVGLIVWIGSCVGGSGTGTDVSSTESTVSSEEPTETTEPTKSYTADGHYVQPDGGNWNLLLVNGWNPLTEAEVDAIPLAAYNEEWDFDERALPYLNQMLDAANAAGCHLWGQSLFRPYSSQARLYQIEVDKLLADGYEQQAAEDKAATVVARPGCSEHNTGLAVDFECAEFPDLDEGFKDTQAYEWLMAHCAEYGFILRFPQDKEAITGVIYEPWHYRYVGVEAATEIMRRGLCLEEYLEEKGL